MRFATPRDQGDTSENLQGSGSAAMDTDSRLMKAGFEEFLWNSSQPGPLNVVAARPSSMGDDADN